MDVCNDEWQLLCGWLDDAGSNVDGQDAMWILKDNTCAWKNMDGKFRLSLGAVASGRKNAVSVSDQPERCTGGNGCGDEGFWYNDRRTLDGE